MAIKSQTIYATGMNRDSLIGTGNSSKFVYENMNLRYVTTEDSTTGSWVTEKGTKLEFDGTSEENLHILEGFEPIGQAVINDQWVLFGIKNNLDYILKLYYDSNTLKCSVLYSGNLNFNSNNHIETTTFYEDEQIQKVYWVDGINPLRMINIMNVKESSGLDTQFDVLPTLSLNEEVTITKEYDGNGMFPSGTIQYFFTYINKYGQESNIFYASPLYYNTKSDRGLNPDGSEFSSNSYTINIKKIDYIHEFDYLRIYSLSRPAEDATPYAKIVIDYKIPSNADDTTEITFKDTNTIGETFDYTALLYLGGRDVVPSTLESKNNTLFLANLNLPKESVSTDLQNALRNFGTLEFVNETRNSEIVPLNFTTNEYPYRPQLKCNSFEVTTFKHGDYYRVGIQFMDYKGIWSEVVYLDDIKNTLHNEDDKRVVLKYTLPQITGAIRTELSKFKKARLVCCYPDMDDRDVIAQGVLCPTMYHPAWENVHAPDRFSSWFFRPTKNGEPLSRPSVQFVDGFASSINGDLGLKIHVNYNYTNWATFEGISVSTLPAEPTQEEQEAYDAAIAALIEAAQNIFSITLVPKTSSDSTSEENNTYSVQYDKVSKTEGTGDNIISIPGIRVKLFVQHQVLNGRNTQNYGTELLAQFYYYKDNWDKIYVYGSRENRLIPNTNNSRETSSVNYVDTHPSNTSVEKFNSPNYFVITYITSNTSFIVVNHDYLIPNTATGLYSLNSYEYNLYMSHSLVPSSCSIGEGCFYNNTFNLFDYHPTHRPIDLGQTIEGMNESRYLYYNDGRCLGGWGWDNTNKRVVNEVQSADVVDNSTNDKVDWGFYIDDSDYYTFHSPDIEFNENIRNFNLEDYYVRIIGQVNQTSWRTEVDIDATPAIDYNGNKGYGVLLPEDVTGRPSFILNAVNSDVYNPYAYWDDIDVYASNRLTRRDNDGVFQDAYKQIDYLKYKYLIYPFHRQYLNNYSKDITIDIDNKGKDAEITVKASSDIKSKIFGTNRVFGSTILYTDDNSSKYTESTGPSYAKVFDYLSESPIKVKASTNIYINYNANINDISEPCRENNLQVETNIYEYEGLLLGGHNETVFSTVLYTFEDDYAEARADILERYGDTSKYEINEVSDLDNQSNTITVYAIYPKTVEGDNNLQSDNILATIKGSYPVLAVSPKAKGDGYLGVDSAGIQITFKSSTHAILNVKTLTKEPTLGTYPSLYLAELYKLNNINRFGGTSESAILNSVFYPCGEPVDVKQYLDGNDSLVMYGTQGDTYYQMYDCLKTCAYGGMTRNQVIEIGSFMCETHINLDGRYDKYKGVTTGLTEITKENYNRINLGYTQTHGLFSYHTLDKDLINLNNFPNQITWTKTKTPGEIVDTWTNITLANVANAEGTMGFITSLNIYNDNLLMFQEHGIAQLGYNEKTAISTENGLPLEIASSNKFTGFAYLSKEIGCQNKWSINTSKNGIMFIDNSRKELNVVGDTIIPLSTKHGFDSFFIEQLADTSTDFVTYYDKNSRDIYYINNNYCLAFNEVTGTFTSFYNYEAVPYMCNISNHSLLFKGAKIWAAREDNNYCKFFGTMKPYWVTYISDGNDLFQSDKVFNIVETRADIFNPNGLGSTVDINPFDAIAAWNSYQKYKEFNLDGSDTLYEWPAVRKFNIWRYVIPRATYGDTTIRLDRIRNPFAFIKLLKNVPDGKRAILHDTVVYFDVK